MIERSLKPKRRWLRLLLSVCVGVVIVFAVLVIYLVLIKPPQVPKGPIRMVRGPDGRLAPDKTEEQEDGLNFEALAANTRSTDSISAASSTTSARDTRFACRRILIVNRSDHLLMQRMAPRLLEHLANLQCAQEVDYSPGGRIGNPGDPAPDVVVVLSMPSFEETGGIGQSRLTATIVAVAGNSLTGGHTTVIDNLTPAVLRFNWKATVDHQSTTTGVASRSAKYKPQAEDIARQLGDALVKLLNGYSEKYGPLPDLPAAFYPAYTPTGPLPFLDGYTLEPVASWHGLMVSNDSCWRLSAPAGALAEIRKKMETAGWSVAAEDGDNGSPGLSARRGDARLSIYGAGMDGDYYVRYVVRMSQGEAQAAIDSTLADTGPTDLLLLFSRSWSDAQRTRALGLLRTRPLTTADANLSVAEMCQGAGRDSQARECLARAAALMLITPDAPELTTRARGIARRLNAEPLLDAPPTAATMLAAGFTELTPGAPPLTRELALDEPALLFLKGPDGKVTAASVRMARTDTGACQVAYVEYADGGRSWGRTGEVTEDREEQLPLARGKLYVTISRKPATDRFLLTASAPKTAS